MNTQYYPALDQTVFRETLPSGLTVTVIPKPGFAQKMGFLAVRFGSVHTEFTLDGRHFTAPQGTAHYLEHRMFELPGRDVNAEFAALGADTNAFTSYGMTAYHFTCTDHFLPCLKLLLEFVSTPYFPADGVLRERDIIAQEIGMHADSPDSRIMEDLDNAMYYSHPVRFPILGTGESIAQITPEILSLCHEAFYVPGNMTLCVMGDVDPRTVIDAAAACFPEAKPVGMPVPFPPEPAACPIPVVRRKMEIAMTTFELGFKLPAAPSGEAGLRQEIVGDLAGEALYGESSPLYLRLYEDGLIDSSFGGGFDAVPGAAMLTCGGDTEQPEAVRDAIVAETAELLCSGIPEAELQRLKRSALGRRIRDLDHFESTCYRVCDNLLCGCDYFRFPELYRAVCPADLTDFLADAIRSDNHSIAIIDPIHQEELT